MPYSLSEQQIDFILSDIKKRGIEIEKLQINLLDHICCLLEEKMNEGDDFESCYKTIIEDFHESGMKGLQKETKDLMRSKSYYRLKITLYILLYSSLSYNLFEGTRAIRAYLKYKEYKEECWTIEGVTLEIGYKDLIEKLKAKYPDKKINDYILVSFEFHDDLDLFGSENFRPWDTTYTNKWESHKKYDYRDLDNLAKLYPNVTFVIAYQRTNEMADIIMKKYSSETQNLLYLKGMNKLLSGYYNFKNEKGMAFPTLFILDNNANVVYQLKTGVEQNYYTNKFLKTLP